MPRNVNDHPAIGKCYMLWYQDRMVPVLVRNKCPSGGYRVQSWAMDMAPNLAFFPHRFVEITPDIFDTLTDSEIRQLKTLQLIYDNHPGE